MESLRKEFRLFSILIQICNPGLSLCYFLWPQYASMGFPWPEYWNGLPCPSSGDLPDPGIKPASPASGGILFTAEPPRNI